MAPARGARRDGGVHGERPFGRVRDVLGPVARGQHRGPPQPVPQRHCRPSGARRLVRDRVADQQLVHDVLGHHQAVAAVGRMERPPPPNFPSHVVIRFDVQEETEPVLQ